MSDFTIMQGSNDPIKIDFPSSVADSIDMHVGIYNSKGEELLHWSKEDITISGSSATCKISQSDSAGLTAGVVYLETKRTNSSGRVICYDKKTGEVIQRYDHHVIVEEVTDNG